MVWYEYSQTADLLGFSQRTVSGVYAKQSKKKKMSTEWLQAEAEKKLRLRGSEFGKNNMKA